MSLYDDIRAKNLTMFGKCNRWMEMKTSKDTLVALINLKDSLLMGGSCL